MKRLLLVVQILLLAASLAAQNKQKDFKTCSSLFLYSDSLQSTDARKSYDYARQALAIGRRWNNDSLISLAHRRLSAAIRNYRPKELYENDSLAVVYAYRSGNTAMVFNTLQLYGTDLLNDNKVQKATDIINTAVALADSMKVPAYRTKIYSIKAFWFFKQFKMKESLAWYNNALDVARTAGDEELIARAKKGVANGNIYSGRADSASSYIFEAIDYYKHTKDLFELGDGYDLLGFAFQVKGNIDKSAEYYLLAASTYELGHEPIKVADKYLSLAGLYISRSKFDQAKNYISVAESRFQQLNNMTGMAMAKNYWGQYYMAKGMKDSASFYYGGAKKISQDANMALLEFANDGYSFANKGEKDTSRENIALAKKIYKKATAMFPSALIDSVVNRVAYQNHFTKQQQKDERAAFSKMHEGAFSELSAELQLNPFTAAPSSADSTISFQYNQQLLEMEAKYKLRAKDDSIRMQNDSLRVSNQQNLINKQEIRQKNQLIVFVLAGILGLTILAWQQYRNRKRAEQFRIAEEKSRQRAEENEATIKKLQKDVIHRVDNMLQQVNALVGHTQESSADHASFEVLKNRLEPLGALYNIFKRNNLSEQIDMQPYLQEICDNIRFVFGAAENVAINIDARVSMKNTTAEKIGLIVNELVFNSFKYAFEKNGKGVIDIQLQQQPGSSYHLTVKDNGKGLPSHIERGRGLTIIEELTETIKGELRINNQHGAGFEIIFM